MGMQDFALNAVPLLSGPTSIVVEERVGLSYWVTLDNEVLGSVEVGSLSCELVLNGKSSFTCTLLNPAMAPVVGQTIRFVDRGKLLFGGKIQAVTLTSPPDEVVKNYGIEAAGWEADLERKLVTVNYTNQLTGNLIASTLSDAGLTAEGFTQGVIDAGPLILQANADHVRASEYLRDIASAGGGTLEIGPDKSISFRIGSVRAAPFPLIAAEPEAMRTAYDMDNYTNKVEVKVTGTAGATVTEIRDDPAEIAARQAVEGGTGIYHIYVKINHPTSNNGPELGRYAISYAFLLMAARSRVIRTISAKLRRPLLDVGQILEVNMPGMDAIGTYQITRQRVSDGEGKILFEIDASYTTRRQLNLESILRIVEAARAAIVLPGGEFLNTTTLTTNQTWMVPGTGTVQVEMSAYGAGGGGSGGSISIGGTQGIGGPGGPGGKGVTHREYTAGTPLTITIGVGGAGGAFPAATGQAGTATTVASPAEPVVARGHGGGGGINTGESGGAQGAPGGAEGTHPFVGEGAAGGVGGPTNGPGGGGAGANGFVIIRY